MSAYCVHLNISCDQSNALNGGTETKDNEEKFKCTMY